MTDVTGPVRVRFAPSPTGFLHIGGGRTALFTWLFARHYGGQFILRIEDTDEKRYVAGAADDLMTSLRWVGITWDEGPDVGGPHESYVQSERHAAGVYRPFVEQLLASGHAYKSFVTEEELTQMRADAEARGIRAFRFRGPERDWTPAQVAEAEAAGKPYTVRLKVPLEGSTSFSDLVRGGEGISVNHADLYDIVLLKSSGMPVYHLAHLVDDHLMGITHVLRSDEWVPSTPYHVLLYRAFGWQPPIFAHLPPILRHDGRGKLSKRKDDVSANRFWERGYLADAMFNYLALQGWSYDDHTEIMTRDEIVERFTIDRVQPSPARWNPEKLLDMNGIYIRRLPTAAVAQAITPFLARAGLIADPPDAAEQAYVERLTPLIHERLKELGEAPELLEFFFHDVAPAGSPAIFTYDPALLVPKKMDATVTRSALKAILDALSPLESWSEGHLEETLRALAEQLNLKPGPLFGIIRIAVTGRSVAPPLFETLTALGKQRALTRLQDAAAAAEQL
ncbi:MAG TPA: glutamate--tRNA ligase [Roseiflexaceae bacterium]|nr:glutamate--tRNA ligase [Roseiflexaceae bacterium]